MSVQDRIYAWEKAVGNEPPSGPTLPDLDTFLLQAGFIKEEYEELEEAYKQEDLVEFADALGDIIWVVYGMANRAGIDLDEVMRAIAESNWTKLEGGVERDETGKVQKGEHYEPPNIAGALS